MEQPTQPGPACRLTRQSGVEHQPARPCGEAKTIDITIAKLPILDEARCQVADQRTREGRTAEPDTRRAERQKDDKAAE